MLRDKLDLIRLSGIDFVPGTILLLSIFVYLFLSYLFKVYKLANRLEVDKLYIVVIKNYYY